MRSSSSKCQRNIGRMSERDWQNQGRPTVETDKAVHLFLLTYNQLEVSRSRNNGGRRRRQEPDSLDDAHRNLLKYIANGPQPTETDGNIMTAGDVTVRPASR